MKSIAVFCGSSIGKDGLYRDAASQLGSTLARKNIEIIYGGGKIGLMGTVADAALQAGGRVTGVIPGFLAALELAHGELSRLITVETMHQRKAVINEMSDGVITLPGGFGTLDELFEMLTWGQLGLHEKPVGILNINGFYDHILSMVHSMVAEGFLKQINSDMLLVSGNIDELLEKMVCTGMRLLSLEVPLPGRI